MTRKIYVSAPMRGVEDENRPLFKHVAEALKAEGLIPMLPPDIVGTLPRDAGIRAFMAADLGALCKSADAVVVVGKYHQVVASKGCWAERMAAYSVGIPVFTQAWTNHEEFDPVYWECHPIELYIVNDDTDDVIEYEPFTMRRWLSSKRDAHMSPCK